MYILDLINYSLTYINELIRQTNAELNKLNVWFSVNRLSLNITKTLGVRPWAVTALPSVEVCGHWSSSQSVSLRQWGVFIVWIILV